MKIRIQLFCLFPKLLFRFPLHAFLNLCFCNTKRKKKTYDKRKPQDCFGLKTNIIPANPTATPSERKKASVG
jgi:hypothetical protein